MRRRVVGLLEALAFAQKHGAKVLSSEERAFIAEARKKKGCPMVRSRLTADDIRRVMELGERCRKYEEERDGS